MTEMAIPGWLRLCCGAAIFLALILLAVWLLQRRLIYLPIDRGVPAASTVLPGAIECSFRTADGLVLGGWFVPAGSGEPGPALLFCNGNAGNRAGRASLAVALRERGISVLLFDYRGYAENPGHPTESGLLADARAAREWLEARAEVDPRRVVLAGESLGAAVALAVAVERPPAGLALRSPFTSLVDVGRKHYPFLPVASLLRDRYPSIDRVVGLRCPLLVAAGGRDGIVPADQSLQLYRAAPVEPKRLFLLEDADHNDPEWLAGRRWIDELAGFVDEVTERQR